MDTPTQDFDPEVIRRVALEQTLDCLWRAYNELPECARQARLIHQTGTAEYEKVAVQLGVDIAGIEQKLMAAISHLRISQIRSEHPGADL